MTDKRATIVVCPMCDGQIRIIMPCPEEAPWFRCPVCATRVRAAKWRPAPIPSVPVIFERRM